MWEKKSKNLLSILFISIPVRRSVAIGKKQKLTGRPYKNKGQLQLKKFAYRMILYDGKENKKENFLHEPAGATVWNPSTPLQLLHGLFIYCTTLERNWTGNKKSTGQLDSQENPLTI